MGMDLILYCRLCAEISISDNKMTTVENDEKLSEIIFKYLSIKITPGDYLPTSVCESCRVVISSFEEFAAKCNDAQIELENLLDQKNVLGDPILEAVLTNHDGNVLHSFKDEIDDRGALSDDFHDDDSDLFNDDEKIPVALMVKKKKKIKKTKKEDDPDFDVNLKKVVKKAVKSKVDDSGFTFVPRKIPGQKKKKQPLKTKSRPRKYSKRMKVEIEPRVRRKRLDLSSVKLACHLCSNVYRYVHQLENHTRSCHSDNIKVLCTCGDYLTSRTNLIRHIKRHSAGIDGKCSKCEKVFITPRLLDRHVRKCLDITHPHSCDKCAKKFKYKKGLSEHKINYHMPIKDRPVFTCENCGSIYHTPSSLKNHIKNMHNTKKVVASIVCDVCGRLFKNNGHLKSHQIVHTEEKNFTCSICPSSFKKQSHLKRHNDTHSDTLYKCPECPAILNTKATLRQHMVVHDCTERYLCAFCNKGYKRVSDLKLHTRRHTGHRPYSCLWCDKTFVDNSNMRDHKKRVHPTELKEYEAINGKPKNSAKKNDRKVVEADKNLVEDYYPRKTPSNIIVYPQLNIKPLPLKCFPDYNT